MCGKNMKVEIFNRKENLKIWKMMNLKIIIYRNLWFFVVETEGQTNGRLNGKDFKNTSHKNFY